MATSVRRLEIRVDQTGTAKKGIGKLTSRLGKLGAIAGPVGIGIGAVATATAALGAAGIAVGAKLIGLGSDAEEMSSKFNVVFGRFAPESIAALDEFGNTVGRSKFELMEMAATVQDTFVPLGFARGEAAAMSVELSKLAVDMGSFNNVADDQVMLDLQSAIVGNHETMRKYGVVITQATLEQELMRSGIAGSIKEATEQEKVQGRLNLIMAGTTDAQGDATATAGSWANQMRALKSTISEGATAMGTELLPVVAPLLKNFTEWVRDIMPKAVEIFKEFAGDLKENIGPALILINDAVRRIAEAFGINTDEVTSTDAVLAIFKTGLDGIILLVQLAAIAMQGLAAAVEGVRDAIKWLIKAWEDMKQASQDVEDAIPDWLVPGSPTPLELGLRGIGNAMGDVNKKMGQGFGASAQMPMAAQGAGAAVVVNLHYSPAVALGDRYEAEEKLVPIIEAALKRRQ